MLRSQVNVPLEFSLTCSGSHSDIFNQIEVDVVFTGPGGKSYKVPAFWGGGNTFTVRFAAPEPGRYSWSGVCTGAEDAGISGSQGELEVAPYQGENGLYKRGRLVVSGSKRYLEHSDGTPFFWLGDTWWMWLCKRASWPDDFQALVADRVKKGFSVIQIIAGLYPDMPPFDERGANEAGFPWKEDYSRINPEYFDMADLRIRCLVDSGLSPCIVGCWGFFLSQMGVDKIKKHWRNLVARYGAYPVTWCLAGEGAMPYYLSETKEKDAELQMNGWTEIGHYVRSIDPYHNLVTIHPTKKGRDQVVDDSMMDFEMLQTGHEDRVSVPNTIKTMVEEYNREPHMPVFNSEVCYEGIGETCRQEVQRLMFWASILNGGLGHTYGANGLWQINTRTRAYGPSPLPPRGMSWGDTPWEDAARLPGSQNLGMAKAFLERFEWWKFEPHPEWIDPHFNEEDYLLPCAAGIPGELRVFFLPSRWPGGGTIKGIEPDVAYHAYLFNPATGEEHDWGIIEPDENGDWLLFWPFPIHQDWVVYLQG